MYRKITPYWIPVFNVTANICDVLKGLSEHPIVNFILEVAEKQLTYNLGEDFVFIPKCPIMGSYNRYNISLPGDFSYLSQFTYGEYNYTVHLYDSFDENIATGIVIFETKFYNKLEARSKKRKGTINKEP